MNLDKFLDEIREGNNFDAVSIDPKEFDEITRLMNQNSTKEINKKSLDKVRALLKKSKTVRRK